MYRKLLIKIPFFFGFFNQNLIFFLFGTPLKKKKKSIFHFFVFIFHFFFKKRPTGTNSKKKKNLCNNSFTKGGNKKYFLKNKMFSNLFLTLVLLLLLFTFQTPLVESAETVTYNGPDTAVYENTDTASFDYGYIYCQPTFSGLKSPLSSYAVITVQVWIQHSYSSDLGLELEAPNGDWLYLTKGRGYSYSNIFYGTLFTDSAAYSVANYPYSGSGVVSPLRPEAALSNFRAHNPNGKWTFYLLDYYPGYAGYVSRVLITIQGKICSVCK